MVSESEPTPACYECKTPVSYETGFSMAGGLGDSSQDRLYCPRCAPNQGKGYTLSDLQKWREDEQVERGKYEMSLMEQLGPDVYFPIKASVEKRRERQGRRRVLQRYQQNLQRIVDTFDRIGVPIPRDDDGRADGV